MTQLNDQPVQTSATCLHSNADIDLVDLLSALWRKKWVIFSFFVSALIMAFVFIWQSNTVYLSQGGYAEPSLHQVQQMVPFPLDEFNVTPQVLFSELLAQLQSNRTRQQFFREFIWQGPQDTESEYYFSALAHFTQGQNVAAQYGEGRLRVVTVSQQDVDPVRAAMLVDKYLEQANDATVRQIEQNFLAAKESAIALLKRQIDGLKFEADQAKEQRVAKLRSAFETAKALGLQESRISQSVGAALVRNPDSAMTINVVEPPLYAYGMKELGAQIEALQKSKGTYFDVEKLPILESKLAQLHQVTFNARAALSYTERDAPIPVFSPIKPRKLLIITLAGVAGLILGVFVVLTMLAFRHHKKQLR